MKRIWNTFCEDISKNKGVKEMTFEKEIVKGFLQALAPAKKALAFASYGGVSALTKYIEEGKAKGMK